MHLLLLLMSLWGSTARPASRCQLGGTAPYGAPLASTSIAKRYHLCCGLRAIVEGHAVIVTDAKGTILAQNRRLIRVADEHAYCPSEGFEQIVSKGNYFTIEQQNCGGWFFINEYITFRYVPSTKEIQLHKVGFSFIDRRNPAKSIPNKVFTKKQFGQRFFSQVSLDSLKLLDR